jgi:hypothetical protein
MLARALLISQPSSASLLLDPLEVDGQTGEWACYLFEGVRPGCRLVGRTFREALEYIYRLFFIAD